MIAVAICATCLLAVPAMAVDVDFSGSYRIQGVSHEHVDLRDDSASDAWFDQRFRLKTTFKVSDNLTLVTRFDALDGKKWGKNIYDDNDRNITFDDNDYNGDNVSWDAAYMVIKTPIGGFLAGRFPTVWEDTGWAQSEGNRERIYYVLPIGNFQAALVYEKWHEYDSEGDPLREALESIDLTGLDQDDADNDKYLFSFSYKTPKIKYTVAGGYYRVQTFQNLNGVSEWQTLLVNKGAATGAAEGAAAGAAAGEEFAKTEAIANWYPAALAGAPYTSWQDMYADISPTAIAQFTAGGEAQGAVAGAAQGAMMAQTIGAPVEAEAYLINPSIRGDFGPLHFDIEGTYATGNGSYDYVNDLLAEVGMPKIDDADIEVYCFNAEAVYTAGPFAFQAGYATYSGDDLIGEDDGEWTGYGLFESGSGWEKTFILFGAEDTNGINQTLGGIGNLASEATAPNYSPSLMNGFQTWYVGVDYALRENLKLGFIYATSKADKVKDTEDTIIYTPYTDPVSGAPISATIPGEKWDDDHGDEYNFTLTWDIYENLQYKFIAAYLDAGDYWQLGDPDADVEDTYSLFHRLTLSF